MKKFFSLMVICAGLASALPSACVWAHSLQVVSSLGVYGDIAQQIGGSDVKVSSILTTPAQDPHLFEPPPDVGQKFAKADIIILNGGGYDVWAEKLADAQKHKAKIIKAVSFRDQISGDPSNPHYWYSIPLIKKMAIALADLFIQADPSLMQKKVVKKNLIDFLTSLNGIEHKIATIRSRYEKIRFAATEPVFDLMANQLGLISTDERLEHAVMNESEPSPADLAAFETNLKNHKINIFFFNEQVSSQLAENMRNSARLNGIPILNISETLPMHLSYQLWINSELDHLIESLQRAHR